MKDIVEEALDSEVQQDESDTVSGNEFGPPKYLYVGIGNRGTERLNLGILPRENSSDSGQDIESVVTRVAFQSDSNRSPVESDNVDQCANDTQAIADLDTEIDCCIITADLDDPAVISEVLSVANSIQDSLVIALLTTSTNDCRHIDAQITDAIGTTVIVEDDDSRFDSIEPLQGSQLSSTDQVVHRLVTDFITLFVCPNLVPVDYARVLNQWGEGRKAVPFAGKFHQSELEEPDYSSSTSFAGPFSQLSTDWFGYAWLGPSFTMADFDRLHESLDHTLRSNTKGRCGLLGCDVDDQLTNSVIVNGVQFIDSTGMT